MPQWLMFINHVAWVTSNLIILYIAIALIVFVLGYYFLFDPKATTGGRLVFRFSLSLIGVIGLVFIGVFLDPAVGREWFAFHGDVLWWRPILRLGVYSYVAYTITSLTVFLAIRKWWPHRLKTAPDRELVSPRHDTHTDEIPIVKAKESEA